MSSSLAKDSASDAAAAPSSSIAGGGGGGGGGGKADPSTSSKVRFEDLLHMVGENGRWQIVIFLFTW